MQLCVSSHLFLVVDYLLQFSYFMFYVLSVIFFPFMFEISDSHYDQTESIFLTDLTHADIVWVELTKHQYRITYALSWF